MTLQPDPTVSLTHEPCDDEPSAPAAAFAWTWAAFLRCARFLAVAVLLVFVGGVVLGVVVPGLPEGVLAALQSVTLWPGEYLAGLAPLYLVILLGNMRAAFLMALLGPVSAWLNARLNARALAAADGAEMTPSLSVRAAQAIADGCIALGRRIFPELADTRREFAARSSAGFAAALPFVALTLNGAVIGLWLAGGLLHAWTAGLAHALQQLLPHGPLEFTALLLAAAAGLGGAERLVPRRPEHDSAWQARAARRWLASNCIAQTLGVLVALLAIAAALELLSAP